MPLVLRRAFDALPQFKGVAAGRLFQTNAAGTLVALVGTASGQVVTWNGSMWVAGAGGGGASGPAGGVLSGTYPNPGFAVDMATQAELNAVNTALDARLDALEGAAPASAAANTVYAGPASGASTVPTFRLLRAADLATGTPTAGFVPLAQADGTAQWGALVAAVQKVSLGFQLGAGSAAIDAAAEPAQEFWTDADWDVTGWAVSESTGTAGDVVLQVQHATAASYPTFAEAFAANRPTLSSSRGVAQSPALTAVQSRGRTCWRVTVVSAATVKLVALTLTGVRA